MAGGKDELESVKEDTGKRGPGRPRGEQKVQIRVRIKQALYDEMEHYREARGMGHSVLVAEALEGFFRSSDTFRPRSRE